MSQFERSKKPTKTEKYSENIKHQKWSQIFDRVLNSSLRKYLHWFNL